MISLSVHTTFDLFLTNATADDVQGWLASDFQKERERHRANAKRISKAVEVYHKTKESKKIKKQKV